MGRRILLLFFVLALTAAASATRVVIQEPICDPATDPHTIGPSALQTGFNPFLPVQGGGKITFCNGTGVNLNSALIAIDTTVPVGQIDCPSSGSPGASEEQLAFSTCALGTDPHQPGVVFAEFFGVFTPPPGFEFPSFPGVPIDHSFTINFNCTPEDNDGFCLTENTVQWPPDTSSHVFVSNAPFIPLPSVPEPASLILLGSGLVAVWYRRKR